MRALLVVVVAVVLGAGFPALASAQRFSFERSFDVAGPSTIDVSTLRGKIDIVAGAAGRVVVAGEATVRFGWDVPANAVELARQVANAPPIERDGAIVRLRPPSDGAARRAVTVSYQVRVPPDTSVQSTSDSGATSVRGVTGIVDVRTQSGAIDLSTLAGAVTVSSGSGAVKTDAIAGPLMVSTSSSSVSGSGLGSSLHVRTQSGAVEATMIGTGDVDVETGSSTIHIRGAMGGVIAKTQSGHVGVQGVPSRPWTATTGSSGVDLTISTATAVSLDVRTRSGSVSVEGGDVQGAVAKGQVKGTVKGGGPLIQINSGSGSVRIRLDAATQ